MIIDNSIIHIEQCRYIDLKKALNQWLMLCSKDLEKDYLFLLHKNGRGKHVIQVDERLTNLQFFFLINHLRYPNYFEYSPNIYGFTSIKNDKLFSVNELGEILKVYMTSDNKGSDSVNVITSNNVTYNINFKPKRTKQTTIENFHQPTFDIDKITQTEVINVPEPLPDDFNPFVNHKSFAKRFYIISLIYLTILLFSVHFIDVATSNNYFVVLILLPFVWVYIEHDYLFYKIHYQKMLIFSITLLCVGFYSIKQELITDTFIFSSILTVPFIFLIFQKILSSFYRALFKDKPDVFENSLKTKFLYEIPLIIGTGISSLCLYNVYEHLFK